MAQKSLDSMTREERSHRTYQRIVYRKLVDLQTSIRIARGLGVPLGLLDELDTEHLIEDICETGDIEYRSIEEKPDYVKPELPDVKTVENLPIIKLDDEDIEL